MSSSPTARRSRVVFRRCRRTIGPTGADQLGRVWFTPETLHDVRSVTKERRVVLFGIAYSDGAIKSLDTPVLDYFPEYADLHTPDRMKVRVRDVLTMTSGLHWDERTYPYSDARNSEIAMDIADDPYRYVLAGSIDAPPGTRFNYSGGDVAVVAAIVTRATKTPLETYARQKLFTPLGIARFEWSKNSNDIPRAASGPRPDHERHGQNRRAYVERRPVGWSADRAGKLGQRSTTPAYRRGRRPRSAERSTATCGGSAPVATNTAMRRWFAAFGNGAQRIWVVPSRKLVIASTGGLYNDPNKLPRLWKC